MGSFTIGPLKVALIDKSSPNTNVNSDSVSTFNIATTTSETSGQDTYSGKWLLLYPPSNLNLGDEANEGIDTIECGGYALAELHAEDWWPAGIVKSYRCKYWYANLDNTNKQYSTITWNKKPSLSGYIAYSSITDSPISGASGQNITLRLSKDSSTAQLLTKFLKNQIAFIFEAGPVGFSNDAINVSGRGENQAFYFTVNTDGNLFALTGSSGSPRAIDPSVNNTFSWEFQKLSTKIGIIDYPILTDLSFCWISLADNTEHQIPLAIDATSITIQADTFPTTGIQWHVEAKNGDLREWRSTENVVETGDRITYATIVSPMNDAYVDEKQSFLLRWSTTNALGNTPSSFEIEWKLAGSNQWNTFPRLVLSDVVSSATDYTYAVPANTFPNGNIIWRIRAYNQDNVAGPWAEEGYFTTIDYPIASTVLSPQSNTFCDEKDPILFEWSASSFPSDFTASKWELQWKTEGSEWANLVTLTQDVRSYTAPADTFPNDVITWRVRGYNGDDVPGDWSNTASFTTIDPIPEAIISAPQDGAWIDEKFAYRFQWAISVSVSDYDVTTSELQLKTEDGDWEELAILTNSERSYLVPADTLSNGNYAWRVKAYNHDDIAGPWSEEARFTTIDPPITCSQLSPSDNVYCNYREQIVFQWVAENTLYFFMPVKFDLQLQRAGEEWDEIQTLTNVDYDQNDHKNKSYTLPANTLDKNVYSWRIRAYNHDDVAGPWSEPASFRTSASLISIYSCSPNNDYRAPTEQIDFTWSILHREDNGAVPYAGPVCELQYGLEDNEGNVQWEALASNQPTQQTSWTADDEPKPVYRGNFSASPDFFSVSPAIHWRVRAYNTDNEPGEWLEASFATADAETSVTVIGPASGAIASNARPLHISWQTNNSYHSAATGIELQWSAEDVEESYQALVLLNGTETSYTVPADTFPEGRVYWRIRAFNQDNAAGPWTTSIITVTTGNGGTVDIIPGELQDDPADIYTGIETCIFPSEYFSPGQVYWRVRCYDSSNNIGAWSDAVSFICYGTPKVSNLTCDEKPFATITWRATGQVSYEIKIDGQVHYGPFHGTDGRFVLPEPLEDGAHTIAVQVQNNLSLLTPWTEIAVEIENIPSEPDPHDLTVSGELDAVISWNPFSVRQGDEFLLYRDNVLIKKFSSTERGYTDRLVLGLHTYQLIQHMPDGYYNRYTHPAVFLSTDVTKIAQFDGGPWFTLLLTSERYPTNTFKRSLATEKIKVMGSNYPVIEVGDFEELSAQYEVVWPFEEREKAYQFKNFFGKAVIIKSRGEQVICGVLDGYEMSVNSQTVGYTFTLSQMNTDGNMSIARSGDVYGAYYTDLDRISFGEMTEMALATAATNPGATDPQYYEAIAKAINELKQAVTAAQ